MVDKAKPDPRRTAELLWGAGERPSRGPKPGLSVARIVRAAIDVADAEGLDALSMQRLANELGFTAMSLYRYVPGKDQLVTLMVDAASGEPPPLGGDDWRADLWVWITELVAVNRRHPWLVRVQVDGPPIGPNGLAWFDACLGVLSRTGLRSEEAVLLCTFLLGSVHGLLRLSLDLSGAAWPDAAAGYDAALAAVVTPERFPALTRVLADRVFETGPGEQDDLSNVDLELRFGIQRLMDGVQSHVDRSPAGDG